MLQADRAHRDPGEAARSSSDAETGSEVSLESTSSTMIFGGWRAPIRRTRPSTSANRMGTVTLFEGRIDEVMLWLEKARSANPLRPIVNAHLASACALAGVTEYAAFELTETPG
jgi:hypothetical protein